MFLEPPYNYPTTEANTNKYIWTFVILCIYSKFYINIKEYRNIGLIWDISRINSINIFSNLKGEYL